MRERGFSLGDGELDSGRPRRRRAHPAFRPASSIAALSISCPAFRFPDDRIDQYGEWVRQTAQKISRALREES